MKLLNQKHLDKNILLKQYELYVGSSEKVSERRMSSNAFMWTIQGALLTILGIGYGVENNALLLFAPLFGIASSYAWEAIIKSYKQLNSGKFKLIHELEKNMPANLYAYEWKLLGEGEEKNLYEPTSHIEMVLPKICLLFWTASLLFWLMNVVDLSLVFELVISKK